MKRTMTVEQKAAMKAAKVANAKRFEAQTVSVDENWRVRRDDEFNWVNEEKVNGKWIFRGFFGKLPAALMALPATMLGEQASGSLNDVLETLKGIKYSILAALPEASKVSAIKPE